MTVQEYLKESPLLFDGAMGTYLAERCPELSELQCERANFTHPSLVREIHNEYLRAGAVAIKTNTFAANCQMMNEEMPVVSDVLRAGWELANEAVQKAEGIHFVFADIGPVPVKEGQDLYNAYHEIVDVFLSCSARCFLFETMENAEVLEEISAYIKEKAADSFVMVSFAASPEGYTRGGFLVKKLFWQMQQCDTVDAVGFNCISGPKHLLEQVRSLAMEKACKYLTVMPNAGYPTMLGNRIHYGADKEYFGRTAMELLEAGVSIVGGCCGTTPEDIESIAGRLNRRNTDEVYKKDKASVSYPGSEGIGPEGQKISVKERVSEEDNEGNVFGMENARNAFAAKLKAGKKVVVVELDPPVEPDIDFFMEGAARYKYAGVDAIDIADCPIAKARIDSSILACKLSREFGITAIPHLTCRDRNINATKALLLGLNIEGVNNVLTVTGDPVPNAMRSQVKTVFSYNSAVLARHIQSFNEEIFAGNPFMVSGALNINALNFDSQILHAKKKIENGVSVLFTQPVLSKRGFENLKRARKELPVKLLGGIMPVVSYRNAAFMNNEMAGIELDEEIIEKYRNKNREEGEELAYDISTKIIDAISDSIDGYYIITPFKRVELILRILEYIKAFSKM